MFAVKVSRVAASDGVNPTSPCDSDSKEVRGSRVDLSCYLEQHCVGEQSRRVTALEPDSDLDSE